MLLKNIIEFDLLFPVYTLTIFFILNIAVLFYHRSLTRFSPLYILALLSMYLTSLFWAKYTNLAIFFYIVFGVCIVQEQKLWLLFAFMLINLFICSVVIDFTASGEFSLSNFFAEDFDERIVETIGDSAGIALIFMIFTVPSFILWKFFCYFQAKKHKKIN